MPGLLQRAASVRVIAVGLGIFTQVPVPAVDATSDARPRVLANFFRRYQCPIDGMSSNFVQAADRNELDWRLLPAIAMVESTGGKYAKGRNIFGWKSGQADFRTIPESIEFVASRLARSPRYAGKDLRALLATFNPARKEYPERVMLWMSRIAPAQ
jgi:hypothetical protein